MTDYKDFFELDNEIKSIDIFLWQKGKECFPRWEKKSVNVNKSDEKEK